MADQTLGEYIAEKVREALDAWTGDTKQDWEDVATAGGNAAAGGVVGDIGKLGGLLGAVAFFGNLGLDFVDPFNAVVDAVDTEGGHLGRAFSMGYIGGYLVYQQLNPFILPLTHEINNITQNEIFDPQTAADLAARGLIPIETARSEAHGSGFDSTHLDYMERAAEARPGLPELLDLYNRGLIDTTTMGNALQLEGFNGDWQSVLPLLAHTLLSPADLALATLRGFMDQQTATTKAGQLGIVAEDFQTLIDNTGEPPGLMQLLEAYRRGFIDQPTLEHGIRESRVRDEWIPVMEKLRLEPMTPADTVRAVVENYMTQDEGARIAELSGLDPQYYPTLVESWGRPIAPQEMGSLVHRGLASQDQFDQAIRESDIKDKYVAQEFLTTQRLIPERLIVTALHYGAIDLQEAGKRFLQLGYSQDDTNILLQLGLHEARGTAHALTRAELVQLYQDGALSKADALSHLTALGYTADDAKYVLQIADIAAQAKEIKAEVAATRTSYIAGAIDAQTATGEMTQAGLTQAQATQNIQVWDREKRRAARTLSESQIVKAAKNQTITYDVALASLRAIGYSNGDAVTLLTSNGVVA